LAFSQQPLCGQQQATWKNSFQRNNNNPTNPKKQPKQKTQIKTQLLKKVVNKTIQQQPKEKTNPANSIVFDFMKAK
jgi:hypothetical protein